MFKQTTLMGSLVAFGMLLGVTSGGAFAQTPHDEPHAEQTEQTGAFQRMDQPLWMKGAVTTGGLGLIGLELWWFLLSKPKARKASTQGGVQEITITVDGGYEPGHVIVQTGQPVRLNFDRKDPSSCLDEVKFPDFRIAQGLPLNQVTTIEFVPDKPGQYEFTCGMNMFRGVVEVQSGEPDFGEPSTGGSRATAMASISTPTHHAQASTEVTSSVQANIGSAGIQDVTVTVAKGYQPQRVVVEAGYPVRLTFDRRNPSRCYDQLLIPDFAIAVDLAPETTTVEFTPEQPGEYAFMCGMKMNRGVITVYAPQRKGALSASSSQHQ